jgi:hypothetical protein
MASGTAGWHQVALAWSPRPCGTGAPQLGPLVGEEVEQTK